MAKKRVLVVDDEPDFVDAVKTILESGGYEVLTANGGVEGLQKVKSEKPDAIVLDVMMPDKDGYVVCDELKRSGQYGDIPILLLTAVADRVSKTRYTHDMAKRTLADDYVSKPVEPRELLKRVNDLLGS